MYKYKLLYTFRTVIRVPVIYIVVHSLLPKINIGWNSYHSYHHFTFIKSSKPKSTQDELFSLPIFSDKNAK